jgi:hypothetical protein
VFAGRYAKVEFDVKTSNLFAKWGIKSKKRKIISQIEKLAKIPLGEFLQEARKELENQGYLETNFATFKANGLSLDVEGISNTPEDVRIFFRAKGQMDVRLKNLK